MQRNKICYSRRTCLWIMLLYSVTVFILIAVGNNSTYIGLPRPSFIFANSFRTAKYGFLVDTSGCRIPDMEAFNPLICKYLKPKEKCVCSGKPPLINSNLSALFISKSALTAHNISDSTKIKCCYQAFYRVGNNSDEDPDSVNFNDTCTTFEGEVETEEEFIQVSCTVNKKVYKSYHTFIPLKEDVEKRCSKIRGNISEQAQEHVSVLLVGMDAVSRLNFHRQMPETLNILQDLNAVELVGYNKVADNTFPNVVPVLTGLSAEELEINCLSDVETTLDKCPWIWKNFSVRGYRTGYGEDATHLSLFIYKKQGFDNQPTDYYLIPYMKIIEDNIGHTHTYTAKLCMGSQITLEVLLNYISKFAITLSSKLTFGFFWGTSLTHDNINYPSQADNLYTTFLNQLITTGVINRTVLVLMSDHGIRWGSIREIYQGRLEERLPYMFFVFPTWFKEFYPEAIANLHRNAFRLTSPFDIHKTLLDLSDLRQLDNKSIRKRSLELSNMQFKPASISLFLPIHESRTCKEAGITPNWCTCQNSTVLSPNETIIKTMSIFLVRHINSLLKLYTECSNLQLAEVKSARLELPTEDLYIETTDKGLRDYVLVVRTTPGNGLFEATVRQQITTNKINVTGFVSRINAYGNQSACVTDYHVKLYCFCRS